MNAKTRREIEKRLAKMPDPTPEQIKNLKKRIKIQREKYGILDHHGFFGNLTKIFR